MDHVDEAILRHLRANSRLSMRRLAELVYMTPPAVAERVRRLEEKGIIAGYTLRVDRSKVSPVVAAYVDVLMKSSNHTQFLSFLRDRPEVREWHRISGDCCYLVKLEADSHDAIEAFLDELLQHANYRANLVLSSTVKED